MSEEDYIAWYNAQWDAIAASFARSRGPSGGGSDPWSFDGGYAGSSDAIGGDSGGGGCAYSSYAACNAAAAGDLWAADRIDQGRSSASEESWYD
jgi:hypothetical protein